MSKDLPLNPGTSLELIKIHVAMLELTAIIIDIIELIAIIIAKFYCNVLKLQYIAPYLLFLEIQLCESK